MNGRRKRTEDVWYVYLTATDGREVYLTFKYCTLTHVKDIVRTYVSNCPYDCRWEIHNDELVIRGQMVWEEQPTGGPKGIARFYRQK